MAQPSGEISIPGSQQLAAYGVRGVPGSELLRALSANLWTRSEPVKVANDPVAPIHAHPPDDTVELVLGTAQGRVIVRLAGVVTTVPAKEQQDDRPASAAERAAGSLPMPDAAAPPPEADANNDARAAAPQAEANAAEAGATFEAALDAALEAAAAAPEIAPGAAPGVAPQTAPERAPVPGEQVADERVTNEAPAVAVPKIKTERIGFLTKWLLDLWKRQPPERPNLSRPELAKAWRIELKSPGVRWHEIAAIYRSHPETRGAPGKRNRPT
jgi:hypothetical protein